MQHGILNTIANLVHFYNLAKKSLPFLIILGAVRDFLQKSEEALLGDALLRDKIMSLCFGNDRWLPADRLRQ